MYNGRRRRKRRSKWRSTQRSHLMRRRLYRHNRHKVLHKASADLRKAKAKHPPSHRHIWTLILELIGRQFGWPLWSILGSNMGRMWRGKGHLRGRMWRGQRHLRREEGSECDVVT